MLGNLWIWIGIIAGAFSLFAIPYGFHLKAKGRGMVNSSSIQVSVTQDIVNGDKVVGNKIVYEEGQGKSLSGNLDQESRRKVVKIKLKRVMDDYDGAAADEVESYKKEADQLAGSFNARGMLSSGVFIKAQMDLSRATQKKIARLWEQMDRNIEDILIENFGNPSLGADFLEEHNRRSELFSQRKEIYHFIEGSPKSWEQRVFKSDNLTKDFKLQ